MAQKTAFVQHAGGVTFFGKGVSNHWVPMDGPADFGGRDAGTRPKELILIGLAGCTASDVATILTKKRVPYTGFEINITADEADEHPKVFTSIHLEFVVHGDNIKEQDIERAIELSETKYCSVNAMLRNSVKITSSFKILPPKTI